MSIHLLNDYSTKLYRIKQSSSGWLDPIVIKSWQDRLCRSNPVVVIESWWDRLCRSNPILVGWCLSLPHRSGVSDISWVGRRGIHYACLPNLKVALLDTRETHASQELDMGQRNMVLASLWCQTDEHLSLEKPVGIHDHRPQTPRDNVACQCSSFDGLSNQDVCMELLHLLFCLCPNVRTKYDSLSRLRPTQGSTARSFIKCLKRWHLDALLITIVVGKLC
jgi:hypothetical protein